MVQPPTPPESPAETPESLSRRDVPAQGGRTCLGRTTVGALATRLGASVRLIWDLSPPKRKPGGKPGATSTGRVTPKGTGRAPCPGRRRRSVTTVTPTTPPRASSRYTPPTPKELKVSPPWVPVLMFTLLVAGALMIILNYLELLPSATATGTCWAGSVLILSGIVTATQYR